MPDVPEYWMLECYRSLEKGGRSIEDFPRIPNIPDWMAGIRFPPGVPEPIVMYWDPDDEAGPPKAFYTAGIPMMARALHKAMLEAGVDNLETYQAEVKSHKSAEVNRDFLAVNIVGVVAAVNMGKSVYDTGGGPAMVQVDFSKVVIDPKKARNLSLFRLAENVSAIVVHDRVKRHLEKFSFGLTFVPPEQWAG